MAWIQPEPIETERVALWGQAPALCRQVLRGEWDAAFWEQWPGGVKQLEGRAIIRNPCDWLGAFGPTWPWIFQTALRCVITALWERSQHGAGRAITRQNWAQTQCRLAEPPPPSFRMNTVQIAYPCRIAQWRLVLLLFYLQTNSISRWRPSLKSMSRLINRQKRARKRRRTWKTNPCAAFCLSPRRSPCQEVD